MQQVEREEGRRAPVAARRRAVEGGGIGPAVGIDHDQLAIEHRRAGRDADGRAGQLGECRGPIGPVGIDDPHVAGPGAARPAR